MNHRMGKKAVRKAFGLVLVLTGILLVSLVDVLSFTAAYGQGGAAPNVITVPDPSLGLVAAEVTMPPKWLGQGTLYNPGACSSFPSLVFRATSPDGLSYVERFPAFAWGWGTGPALVKNTKDCFPVNGQISAQEFLKYLANTLDVEYVSDAPVPEKLSALIKKRQDDANAQSAQLGMHGGKSMDVAQAYVRSKNGTFVMKGLLEAVLDCNHNVFPGIKSPSPNNPGMPGSDVHYCSAGVRYTVAPETKFAAVQKMWDEEGMGGKLNPQWVQAWNQRRNDQQQAENAGNIQAQKNLMAAQQRQFQHDMAVRQQMHEQFLASMRRATDASMARTQASMNARSTAASDWVDYALDQKTVADPNTGQISKVSSSYAHTWIDDTGKVSYQTNNPSANPNGVLPGTWTQQQTVHGNGTPQ